MKTLTIHPKSDIESWGAWPDDVRSILEEWNKKHALTFVRVGMGWPWERKRKIFQCQACEEWHEPPKNGVAVYKDMPLCDQCLIRYARVYVFLESL